MAKWLDPATSKARFKTRRCQPAKSGTSLGMSTHGRIFVELVPFALVVVEANVGVVDSNGSVKIETKLS